MSPTIVLVASFAATILVGAVILKLPMMSVSRHIDFIDALFTATSAVCVTGLIVVDTGSYFTLTGQWVVLLLIQIGALGILTFSTFFVILLRGEASLRGRMLIQEAMTHFPYRNLFQLVRNILFFTFGAEAIGAVLLWLVFRARYGNAAAGYYSIFHAVSAFCNAGFSPWADSLMGYVDNASVNIIIMLLIIAGGLGFTVIIDIGKLFLPREEGLRRLSLHSRLVLTTTCALIVGGAALFWLLERVDVAFTGRPFFEQILASFFHSVSARTAGFNTVNIGGLANATLFLLIFLMFVGASPGSVGGGVKTTTFSIYLIMVVSYLRGKQHVEVFGRTIPPRIISKAIATTAMAFALIIVSTYLVQVFETGRSGRVGPPYFMDWLFEVVSAFGTVGLSTGVTPTLNPAGKTVIIFTMFAGRIGPLGLVLSLFGREIEQRYKYPEENVMIG